MGADNALPLELELLLELLLLQKYKLSAVLGAGSGAGISSSSSSRRVLPPLNELSITHKYLNLALYSLVLFLCLGLDPGLGLSPILIFCK